MFFLFQNSHNSTIFGFKNTTKPISPLNNVPKAENDKGFPKIFKTLHRIQILFTRLLGRFALIFYLNCEHVLLKKKSRIFKNLNFFTKLKTFKTHFFIFIIHKPSLWSRDVPQQIWARSVQPFWRLLDTNKQTNKQTDNPNLYIDY